MANPYPPLAPVVLVTGKGGVGKTTLAAGLAEAAAARDGRAVLVEFGDGEAGKRALGRGSKVRHEVVVPAEAVEASVSRLLGSRLLGRLFTANFAVRRMLRAAPALRELAMLDAVGLIADRARGSRVVVDMPATGHGLAWMRLPLQMRDLFGSGGLYELSERLVKRIVAPEATSVVIVTLPERLVLHETLELCAALEKELGMPPARLVVNQFPTALPDAAVAQAQSLAARGGADGEAAQRMLELLVSREGVRQEALETLSEASSLGVHIRPLLFPSVFEDPDSKTIAQWLAEEKAA
jgi:arsenite-transporting ATPase